MKDLSRNGRETSISTIGRSNTSGGSENPGDTASVENASTRTGANPDFKIRSNSASGIRRTARAERTFVGGAIVLFERTLVILSALLERNRRVKVQISGAINDCEVMVLHVS